MEAEVGVVQRTLLQLALGKMGLVLKAATVVMGKQLQ